MDSLYSLPRGCRGRVLGIYRGCKLEWARRGGAAEVVCRRKRGRGVKCTGEKKGCLGYIAGACLDAKKRNRENVERGWMPIAWTKEMRSERRRLSNDKRKGAPDAV